MVLKVLIIKSSAVSPVSVQLKQQSDTSRLISRKSRQQKITQKDFWFFFFFSPSSQIGSRPQLEVVWNPIRIGFLQIRHPSHRILKCLLCLVAARHTTRRQVQSQGESFRTAEPAEDNMENKYRTVPPKSALRLDCMINCREVRYGFSSALKGAHHRLLFNQLQ